MEDFVFLFRMPPFPVRRKSAAGGEIHFSGKSRETAQYGNREKECLYSRGKRTAVQRAVNLMFRTLAKARFKREESHFPHGCSMP
ncbi:hypothetical protein DMI77_01215 [Akkermansia muciniphila]|nr:hypothetical protein DMI77_01215 [Akkermansia muciniphila]